MNRRGTKILREEAWQRLDKAMDVVQQSAAEKYGQLSDEEVMDLVNEEIKIMRTENTAARPDTPATPPS